MWLLNVHTRKLEYFQGNKIPPYAILSHRWEDGEISFQDLNNGVASTKKAYPKLDNFCITASHGTREDVQDITDSSKQPTHPAFRQDLSYVWIDTCCIDKSSSAELSEAINSMYQWYKDATVCYAYLSDVLKPDENSCMHGSMITRSEWFTRGWTLQELIAPFNLIFFDRDWNSLGTKREYASEIASSTGISRLVLENAQESSEVPAAWVFSWAADRSTTREEDRAYSLFGLLGVNMPLLYGEGSRAFHRLQETLLTSKDDTTVLAWDRIASQTNTPTSMFANSPSDYSELCRQLKPISDRDDPGYTKGPQLSGKGLTLRMYVVPISYHVYFIPLAHTSPRTSIRYRSAYGMVIERWQDGLFRRLFSSDLKCLFPNTAFDVRWQMLVREVTIARDSMQSCSDLRLSPSYFHVTVSPTQTESVHHRSADLGNRQIKEISAPSCYGVSDIVSIRRSTKRASFFLFGLDINFIPFCMCVTTNLDAKSRLDPTEVFIHSSRAAGKTLSLVSQNDMMLLVLHSGKMIGGHREQSPDAYIEFFSMPMAQSGLALHDKEAKFRTFDGINIHLQSQLRTMESMTINWLVQIDLEPGVEELPVQKTIGKWEVVVDEVAATPRQILSQVKSRDVMLD